MHEGLIKTQSAAERTDKLHRKQTRPTNLAKLLQSPALLAFNYTVDNSFTRVVALREWTPAGRAQGAQVSSWACESRCAFSDSSPENLERESSGLISSSVLLTGQQPRAAQRMRDSPCIKLPDWLCWCQTRLFSDSHSRSLAFHTSLLSNYNLPDGECSAAASPVLSRSLSGCAGSHWDAFDYYPSAAPACGNRCDLCETQQQLTQIGNIAKMAVTNVAVCPQMSTLTDQSHEGASSLLID